MKNFILRLIYDKYRPYFYNFLVEDTVGSIPKEVSEPSMAFLANGKDKINRWGYYWISMIQARIVVDKTEIEVQQGMILAIKIFMNLVSRQQKPRVEEKGKVEEEKKDLQSELDESIRAIQQHRDDKKKKK